MNIEEIKVGETYNVRLLARYNESNHFITFETPTGRDVVIGANDFEAVSPVEKPKHDPCRLFKKGDIVEMDTHGRDIAASMKSSGVALGKRYTVTEDENNTGYVSFIGDDGIEHHSMFFWLKLVTPVEELEPYFVVDAHTHWHIAKDDGNSSTVAIYSNTNHPHAKESAEAECDRLNAEWRKSNHN